VLKDLLDTLFLKDLLDTLFLKDLLDDTLLLSDARHAPLSLDSLPFDRTSPLGHDTLSLDNTLPLGDTGWRRLIGSLISIGHFPQK